MTGRTLIDGQTRKQIIWQLLRDTPLPVREVWRYLLRHAPQPGTYTSVDSMLRTLWHDGQLSRVESRSERNQRIHLYQSVGTACPLDGRIENIRKAVAASVVARRHRDLVRAKAVDTDEDEDENWGGGGCARKTGTPAELPGIPTLAELLAR